MKKWIVFFFSIMLLISLNSLHPVQAQEKNEKPTVIPSLQEWEGSTGFFTISTDSRIIVDPDYSDALMDTADVFKEDLKELVGKDITIKMGDHPSAGDIFLTMQDETDKSIGEEGYHFIVEDTLTIQANTETGVYYGTRSALQILVQDPEKSKIPRGVAKDYPKYQERGFMLDVGRKYFPMDFLKDYAKVMGWYKMNDFQLHLNDNEIFKDSSREHWDAYSAFRLENDMYPELTAKDGHYTKQEFRELQDLAGKNGLTITPEFDTPSHALAFTKVRPDLVHPDLPVDHLDITRQESVDFVESVWDEYLGLFDTDAVHIGADEFYRNDTEMSNVYRNYINTLNQHMKEQGKSVRAWGGLTYYKGDVQVDKDVVFNIWNVGWYNPEQAIDEGYKIINSDDGLLYIVPKANYYHDYLDTKWLYNNWEPTVFSGGITLSDDEPNLLGGMFAVWNDLLGENISIPDVHDRAIDAMPTLAEKMWRGESDDVTFTEFEKLTSEIGGAPGTNLTNEVETKTDTVLNYSFDDVTKEKVADSSGNDYSGTLHDVEVIADGKSGKAVSFANSTSHITTDLDSKGFPWTVSTWVKLEKTDQPEEILLDSDYGSLKLTQTETGNAGFTREGYDYSFDTAIPTGRWVHVAFRGDLNGTSLFIDGKLQDTLPDNLLLPMHTVGSETNAFKGVIDELKIFDRKLSSSEIAQEADAPKWLINIAGGKPATASSSETDYLTPGLAVDENESTRWSSGHSDDEWIYVDLLKQHSINKVVLKWEDAYAKGYKIQVSNDAQNWKDVYVTEEGTGGKEIIRFPVEKTRYVRMKGTKRAINWGYSLYELKVYQPVTAEGIKERIDHFQSIGGVTSEQAAHLLTVHMTAVQHYEEKEQANKIIKHMESFQLLIEQQKNNGQLSEKAFKALNNDAEELIAKWVE
ncbi:hypothetical protein CFK37_08550 [Virgibacillus phasianinus]|uniref:F5/8 type C domain-containing protein n=1 Tax=Virgibacillus phasianinus TaxID=2017483 RepID=A0A220U2Q9_9BACI|nr:family 20 glycosylhydrolase [Virgibacillus phasianinus]ASK62206.1 hypothetical protein CFK37_08550 [Virgibacillus phasianinus]